jgi:hypothetical protein
LILGSAVVKLHKRENNSSLMLGDYRVMSTGFTAAFTGEGLRINHHFPNLGGDFILDVSAGDLCLRTGGAFLNKVDRIVNIVGGQSENQRGGDKANRAQGPLFLVSALSAGLGPLYRFS